MLAFPQEPRQAEKHTHHYPNERKFFFVKSNQSLRNQTSRHPHQFPYLDAYIMIATEFIRVFAKMEAYLDDKTRKILTQR
jgi:hypothetical protein